MLTNVMPETKSKSKDAAGQLLYGLYQFAVPIMVSFGITILTTLIVKKEKYQSLSEQFSNFDVALFSATPIFAYLFAEAMFGSGLNTLILCGML